MRREPIPMSVEPNAAVRRGGWMIVAMLAFSTFLNYVDRQTLALLSRPIQDALLMDDKAYAAVVTAFMIAYTVGNVSSGVLVDRLGAVRAMPVFVILWSVAGALCGLVENSTQLGVSRFFLGLFETGNFMAASIIVSMFLPAHQKAFGIGIYTAAAMLGAAVSPPMVTLINELAGWRVAFMLMGAGGLVWAVVWYMLPVRGVSSPAASGMPDAQRAQGARGAQGNAAAEPPGAVDIQTWSQAFREPRVWAQALGTMLTFPVWFFYLNWFPKYLTDERGLSTLEMGGQAWIVYLFAGIGCMLAGLVIAALQRRSRLTPLGVRLWVMAAVAVLAPLGAVNYFTPPVAVSLASAAWVALVHMIWQITVTSLPLELFTSRSLGKVLGIVGVTSGLGGAVSTWLIGNLVSVVSYRPMFVAMAAVYVVAMAVMLALYKRGGVRLLPPR